LTDLTQRSAYEFKFGLLAGKRIGFTLPDSISSRKIRRTSYLGHAANGGSLSGIPTAPWSCFVPVAPSTPDPGTDQELLLRNEYLAAENRILKAQIKGRNRSGNVGQQLRPNHFGPFLIALIE
jgi:hypothetical protein